MKQKRNWLKSTIIVILCAMLSGCWDMTEINRSSLITGIAIEPGGKDGKRKVTFEILNTAEAQALNPGKGGTPTTLYTSEGNSITDTVTKLNDKAERLLLTAHNRIVVIDERIARKGLFPYMDVFQRSRYMREDIILLVAHNVPASQLLQITYPGGMYASLKLQTQVENFGDRWGGVPASRLFDYTQATLTEGREMILAAVTLQGNAGKSGNMDSIKALKPDAVVKMSGSAVFREDKLIGFINADETRFVNIVRNKLKATSLSVPMGQKDQFASLRYRHNHASMEVTMKGKIPHIRVHIEGEGQIANIQEQFPLDKVEGYAEMEQRTAAYLNAQVKETIAKVQQDFGVDVFGFGEHLYRHRFKQFKPIMRDWNALFAKAQVEVTSEIHITHSDLKTKQLRRESMGISERYGR
ncbi:Ger(x)C family spore germination protein [Paenibacillus sp. LHD-117]|uniref:Ger(x)C family spore germination protein n=1 Tax=Paenibacillus sp. LHD-117 TaxID=3071412 RepID=UPI0027E00BFB|nr:Ger(x)C family spore germination protein [Paenibacillus sp. LHD-117]MDQ6419098.1 Ger(x)C family spore germination protein [Paenibacillus sp. LHD-117]